MNCTYGPRDLLCCAEGASIDFVNGLLDRHAALRDAAFACPKDRETHDVSMPEVEHFTYLTSYSYRAQSVMAAVPKEARHVKLMTEGPSRAQYDSTQNRVSRGVAKSAAPLRRFFRLSRTSRPTTRSTRSTVSAQGAVRLMWSSVVFRQGRIHVQVIAVHRNGRRWDFGALGWCRGGWGRSRRMLLQALTPSSGSAEADQRGNLREQQ